MVQPQIDGMEILGLIGEGACGAIYIARDSPGSPPALPDTRWYAVRVFNSLSVNRPLMESMVKRLDGGTHPDGVIPVTWKESTQGGRCMIMPMLAEIDEEEGTIAPRSLQERLGDYPENGTWGVIEKIAHALASMHRQRIPHGNLKPGNIFFDDRGEVHLADFAMGHMPGVGMLPYTDALLYAPPEQLREPGGYLLGKGYRWDTYAFAVLAFRLLTQKFPRCEATFSKVAPLPGESHVTDIQADVIKLAERLEHRELGNWTEEAADERECKRREVIKRCLSLNPEERYGDLNEVVLAWDRIDIEAKAADEKARLRKKVIQSRLKMFAALVVAGAGITGCIILSSLLTLEKIGRGTDNQTLSDTIVALEVERDDAQSSEAIALTEKKNAENREQAAAQAAAAREALLRTQLLALGVSHDHLLAWMIRNESTDLPELKNADPGRDIMVRELQQFLKLTEGDDTFQPIRARIAMQLAELALHGNNPEEADRLLDRAVAAWDQAGIDEPDHASRKARARLVALLQSLDQNDPELTARLLPKARKEIQAITAGDETETRRINAVMQVIDGRMIQGANPAKALEHFQLALRDLQGVHKALPDHVVVRSDLARFSLHSAALSESLDRVDDATRLRGEAATHLRWLLEKNPELKLAKVKLAEIEIMAAESDMRAGNDSQGAARLTAAEKLLSGLPADDTTPDGVSMQIATAKGLRTVLLRDQGRTTSAAKSLDDAILLTEKIVEAHPDASEPLYRLAVFKWQRAGLSGDAGDTSGELNQGKQAASLMQRLLKIGAGKRDTELRRSLAYLYGDLGHTASSKGKKSEAATYFKSAASMWQSLISKNGKLEEYTEGLKWSQSRFREVGGR
ncbi:MAG: hypothetical protein KJO21_08955 [Verrucomicrobiae bacterium]|nr:hypothetical protein [Verrucomicrobiae bacterium]NNJ42302.1 hypothetical protein [Akkermansiaceae bacterium]